MDFQPPQWGSARTAPRTVGAPPRVLKSITSYRIAHFALNLALDAPTVLRGAGACRGSSFLAQCSFVAALLLQLRPGCILDQAVLTKLAV